MKIKFWIITIIALVISLSVLLINNKLAIKASNNDDITKPLIVLRSDNMVDLNYENYNLLSTNLKTNIVGTYYAKYQKYNSDEILTKRIYVVDDNNSYFGASYEKVILELGESIVKYQQLDNGQEIYVTMVTNPEVSQEEPTKNMYLICRKGSEIMWRENVMSDCYCSLKDFVIDQNEIILYGQSYFQASGLAFFIAKYDLTGNLIKIMYCGNTGSDIIEKLIISNDCYYVCGNTTSTKGSFKGERLKEDGFVMAIDKVTLKEMAVYMYPVEYNDSIVNMYELDGYIYLVQRYIDKGILSHKVLKIDKEGNVLKEHKMINYNGQRIVGMMSYQGAIIIVLEDKAPNSSKYGTVFYEINNGLYLVCYVALQYQDYHMYLEDVKLRDNMVSLLYSVNTDDKCGYQLRTVNLDDYEVNMDFYQNSENANSLKIKDETTIIALNDNEVKEISNYIIRINSLGDMIIDNELSNPNNVDIVLNGIPTLMSPKSKVYYDLNRFGLYDAFYYFSSDKFDFCFNKRLNVLPNLSIANNAVYDNNLVVTFNGKGILNETVIESGYVITSPGEYKLIVEGKESVLELNFVVANLSTKIPSDNKATEMPNNVITKEDTITDQSSGKESDMLTKLQKEDSQDVNSNIVMWPLVIPSIFAIFATVFIIKGTKV